MNRRQIWSLFLIIFLTLSMPKLSFGQICLDLFNQDQKDLSLRRDLKVPESSALFKQILIDLFIPSHAFIKLNYQAEATKDAKAILDFISEKKNHAPRSKKHLMRIKTNKLAKLFSSLAELEVGSTAAFNQLFEDAHLHDGSEVRSLAFSREIDLLSEKQQAFILAFLDLQSLEPQIGNMAPQSLKAKIMRRKETAKKLNQRSVTQVVLIFIQIHKLLELTQSWSNERLIQVANDLAQIANLDETK